MKENDYTLCSADLLRVIHPHDINHLEEEEVELENKTKVSNHQQIRLAKFQETKFMHTTITTSKEILKEMRKRRRRSCSFLID